MSHGFNNVKHFFSVKKQLFIFRDTESPLNFWLSFSLGFSTKLCKITVIDIYCIYCGQIKRKLCHILVYVELKVFYHSTFWFILGFYSPISQKIISWWTFIMVCLFYLVGLWCNLIKMNVGTTWRNLIYDWQSGFLEVIFLRTD